jgi:hypothetical protein
MTAIYRLPFILVLIAATWSFSQAAFEITALEGTAKIQRSSKQKWEKLSVGSKIGDNDMVETFFQTKLTIAFGEKKNSVIIGSNSNALFAIALKGTSDKKAFETSLSLFSGGLFAVIAKRMRVSIFSTSAVADVDSGSVAVIVDGKNGETGVLVLGGSSVVRSISQQKGKELSTGNTTVIVPGREPSPPLHVTYRHVAVLKHFFGDKYISDVLQAATITPSDDRGGNKVMLSDGANQPKPQVDALFYKRLFDLNKIYGSILEDRGNRHYCYAPVHKSPPSPLHHGSVTFLGGAGSAGGRMYPSYTLVPEVRYPYVDAGLRFRATRNILSETVYGVSGQRDILDKIHHITAGSVEDSLFITAGAIENLTFGQGLVVDRFRNTHDNRIAQPLGLNGKMRLYEMVSVGAFIADLTDPTLGGMHIGYEPSLYSFGAGYYFDRAQYRTGGPVEDLRYARMTPGTTLFPDTASVLGEVAIYEFGFGATVTESYQASARLYCDFAQKRLNGRNDGYMLRAPSVQLTWTRWCAEGGMLFESGRILAHQFNDFYFSRRSFYKSDGNADTLLTANTSLWDRRSVVSVFFGAGVNPVRGLDLKVAMEGNIKARNTYAVWTPVDSTTDTMRVFPRDYSFDASISLNRDFYRHINYARVYIRQVNARLFPAHGGTYFPSWNSEAGFSLVTAPIRYDLSLECGGRLLYLDRDARPDDVVDASDRVFEFFAGIRWDFL